MPSSWKGIEADKPKRGTFPFPLGTLCLAWGRLEKNLRELINGFYQEVE